MTMINYLSRAMKVLMKKYDAFLLNMLQFAMELKGLKSDFNKKYIEN